MIQQVRHGGLVTSRKLRDPLRNRILRAHPPVFRELAEQRDGDRLGDRRDAEPGGGLVGNVEFVVGHAPGPLQHDVLAAGNEEGPGEMTVGQERGHVSVDSRAQVLVRIRLGPSAPPQKEGAGRGCDGDSKAHPRLVVSGEDRRRAAADPGSPRGCMKGGRIRNVRRSNPDEE